MKIKVYKQACLVIVDRELLLITYADLALEKRYQGKDYRECCMCKEN